jgi:hypothetical protein
VIEQIDGLLEQHTDCQIAAFLNRQGRRAGKGGFFSSHIIARLRREYGLKKRYDCLRAKGLLTPAEMAARLDVAPCTVRIWGQEGLLSAQAYNDRNERLYECPTHPFPVKMQGRKLSQRRARAGVTPHSSKEVQYEA